MLPRKEELTIGFAHVAYQFQNCFAARRTGIANFEVRDPELLRRRIGEADVLVISGLWENSLLRSANKLRFIQSISAGTDQYPRDQLEQRSIRLASAQGTNARAVAEHGMALILALSRRLPEARDNQRRHVWRGMISDLAKREDELGGKALLVIGMGRIGGRLGDLARAFGMHVIGIRRNPELGAVSANEIHGLDRLSELLGRADFVVLTCPLSPGTEKLIDTAALARMKRSAYLINLARGRCVEEPALISALVERRIAGAALDVTVEEPLPSSSPLWELENALVTPHTGGETRRYEENVIDLLLDNLALLWRGETQLRNQVV